MADADQATSPSGAFDHKTFEARIWKKWMEEDYFHADTSSDAETYSIIIPPPNVTDRLHMGHGLNNTIQDILIRHKRMSGYNTCWLPGTDHAGIATQMMVEKSLEEQGTSRKELGREAFFQRCVEWKEENGGVIIEQLKRLGASCDFKRQAYTMDPHLSAAVRKVFVDLYNDGYIYRGHRLVNWDPELKTAISDDEVESREVSGNLWYFRYPLVDDPETFLTIATTRPETMLGDAALCVHPDDERYQEFIGKKVTLPLVGKQIPVIADEYVKMDYGTGCLKITPAHDANDFAIGQRHKLPQINIMNDDATLNQEVPERFQGLARYDARTKVVEAMKELGLWEKTEQTRHAVPYSDRSKVPIEPLLSKQWYVKMEELVKPAIAAAKSGELRFYPDSFKKTYLHWLENIQDWCISRQLWWGHRIPIWYCGDCQAVTTGIEDPAECGSCGSASITQDNDVLDTWFSSWLWPLSPFGWPEETSDLEKFYPSQVLVTGPDIIYLWVARMVIAGYYLKGNLCFNDVYFNAIICDKQGRKFSKTLRNGIDPLEVIGMYGADAVRYTTVSLAPIGGRVKMDKKDFQSGHRFMNKLWNAHRFLKLQLGDAKEVADFDAASLNRWQQWLLRRCQETTESVLKNLEIYRINDAVESMFHLIWRDFCDWGLELAKEDLSDQSPEGAARRQTTASVLVYAFETCLRLAAPVIPFITEELWQNLPAHPKLPRKGSLCVSAYPNLHDPDAPQLDQQSCDAWQRVMQVISGVRSLRSQAKVPPKESLNVVIKADGDLEQVLGEPDEQAALHRLAGLSQAQLVASTEQPPANSLVATGRGFSVHLPVAQYLDVASERKRLAQEVQKRQKVLEKLAAKLANKDFVDRAPEDVIVSTKAQQQNLQRQVVDLQASLESFGDADG